MLPLQKAILIIIEFIFTVYLFLQSWRILRKGIHVIPPSASISLLFVRLLKGKEAESHKRDEILSKLKYTALGMEALVGGIALLLIIVFTFIY